MFSLRNKKNYLGIIPVISSYLELCNTKISLHCFNWLFQVMDALSRYSVEKEVVGLCLEQDKHIPAFVLG